MWVGVSGVGGTSVMGVGRDVGGRQWYGWDHDLTGVMSRYTRASDAGGDGNAPL